jgi:pyridoxamine 5'-phosphate oxidase
MLDRLLPDPLPDSPLPLVRSWLGAADALGIRNPTAMALATRNERGDPDVRFVLCRGFDERDGFFVFFTDGTSAKGRQLAAHPRAAVTFYWDALECQLRVRGPVLESPAAESDAYFASRPGGAQISATISAQSQPIAARHELLAAQRKLAAELGVALETSAPGGVPRPPRWGGFRIWAEEIELWIGQPNRLHERALFARELTPISGGFRTSAWRASRLAP